MVLTIGELAGRAGVNVQTVRYYERRGLMPKPARTPAGYRQYEPEDADRIRFIRRAQGLGFSLREIADLLTLRVENVATCGAVEARARQKIVVVAGKIDELQRMKATLERLAGACRTHEPTSECPILEVLDDPIGGSEGDA